MNSPVATMRRATIIAGDVIKMLQDLVDKKVLRL